MNDSANSRRELFRGKKAGHAKDSEPRDIVAEQTYIIQRLRMENELLRDFMRSMGRR